jgi:hypothetical protein
VRPTRAAAKAMTAALESFMIRDVGLGRRLWVRGWVVRGGRDMSDQWLNFRVLACLGYALSALSHTPGQTQRTTTCREGGASQRRAQRDHHTRIMKNLLPLAAPVSCLHSHPFPLVKARTLVRLSTKITKHTARGAHKGSMRHCQNEREMKK